MKKFRYRLENRFAELDYDAPELRKELLAYFEKHVRPLFEKSHENLNREQDNQLVCHLCYDCNIKVWQGVYNLVKNIASDCKLPINWEQIKHTIKFTFIVTPPGGCFMPHTNYYMIAPCAFNIPLKGTTEIRLYENTDISTELDRHVYINPCILNPNKTHAVFNETNEERIILKTHMSVVPFNKLIETYETDIPFRLFDEPFPWESDDVKTW